MYSSTRLLGSNFYELLPCRDSSFHTRTHQYDYRHIRLCLAYETGLENKLTEKEKNRISDHLWSWFLVSLKSTPDLE